MSSTLHTGGAVGSDTEWIHYAMKHNHHIRVYTFDGYKHTRIFEDHKQSELVTMDKSENALSVRAIQQASEHMKKIPPSIGYSRNLLKRTYALLKDVDSLYAIGELDNEKSRLGVGGMTGWTVEMFLDILIEREFDTNCLLNIYLYDQNEGRWKQLEHRKQHFEWIAISQIPKPNGHYAGIGSREMTDKTKNMFKVDFS